MGTLARRAIAVLLVFALLYGAALAGVLSLRRDLIYPFSSDDRMPADVGASSFRVAELPTPDGALPIWVSDPEAGRPTIVYFMGNSGALPKFARRLRLLADAGFGVAAMAYRGGGGVPGAPSESQLTADARAFLDGLDKLLGRPVTADQLVIYGVSLGTGLATIAASEVDLAALVLEAPFDRLCRAAENAYPIFPACLVMWDERYDSADRIADVDAPVLILHGSDDAIIPADLGKALFEAAEEPKVFELFDGARHYNLYSHGAFEAVTEFLAEHVTER